MMLQCFYSAAGIADSDEPVDVDFGDDVGEELQLLVDDGMKSHVEPGDDYMIADRAKILCWDWK